MVQSRDTLKMIRGNPTVFVTYGALGNCKKLATWVREELGLKAIDPKVGETYEL